MAAIKSILGVRTTTPNELCLTETGRASLRALVKDRQYRFFLKARTKRQGITDDHLIYALELCRQQRLHGNTLQMFLIQERIVCQQIYTHKERLLSSKDRAYVTLNPQLSVHLVYTCTCICRSSTSSAPEYQRMEFSRLKTLGTQPTNRDRYMAENTART